MQQDSISLRQHVAPVGPRREFRPSAAPTTELAPRFERDVFLRSAEMGRALGESAAAERVLAAAYDPSDDIFSRNMAREALQALAPSLA